MVSWNNPRGTSQSGPSNPHLRLEIYRHGRPEVEDISDHVTHVVWEESISSPWQSLSVTWKAPLRDSFTQVLAGDWVILRMVAGGGYSSMLARVEKVDHGIASRSGTVVKDPSSFTAVGWWAFLHTVKIFSHPGLLGADDTGTLLSLESWAQALLPNVSTGLVGRLGDALTALFQRLAAVHLPASLTGNRKTLGELIPVVHSEELAQTFAPRRAQPHDSVDKIGKGFLPGRIASHLNNHEITIGEMLSGTFVPDNALIELFPTFERFAPNSFARPPEENASSAPLSSAPGSFYAKAAVSSSLAEKLGGWPSLVYRFKPFRTRPLREVAGVWVKDKTDEAEQILDFITAGAFPKAIRSAVSKLPPSPQSEANDRIDGVLSDKFDKITWNYVNARAISQNQIRSFRCHSSDVKRVNAATFALSYDGSNGPWGQAELGIPLTYDEEIRRHGLRIVRPVWPFTVDTAQTQLDPNSAEFGTDEAKEEKVAVEMAGDLITYLRTVCAQYLQFYKNNHLYGEGEVTINFRDAVLFGETETDTVGVRFFDIKPGEVISLDLTGDSAPYYAYAESVRHSFRVESMGVLSGNTSIQFSHGHFGVGEDTLAKATKVPVKRVAAGAAETEPAAVPPPVAPTTAPTTGSTPCKGSPAVFPRGGQVVDNTSQTSNFTSLDPSKFPSWLKDWGVSRGFKSRYYAQGGSASTGPAAYMSPWLNWQRIWVSTAIAYVIETYWRIRLPSARIKVLSSLRTSLRDDIAQNHTSGSAIDFAIVANTSMVWDYPIVRQENGAYFAAYSPDARQSWQVMPPELVKLIAQNNTDLTTAGLRLHLQGVKVNPDGSPIIETTLPVLQTWAALSRLEAAKRIPGGAKGLYLNCGGYPDEDGTRRGSAIIGVPLGLGAFGINSKSPSGGVGFFDQGQPVNPGEPLGSSSGVHFDFRGSYGRLHYVREAGISLPERLLPTKYVWVNPNGKGPSTLKDTRNSRAASTFLQNFYPSVYTYYTSEGEGDPHLGDAEDERIPNVQQVLGQVPSCFWRGP